MSITPKMIEAGKAAYWGHYVDPYEEPTDEGFVSQIIAIYEAMEQAWIQEARKLEKYIPVIPETHSHR